MSNKAKIEELKREIERLEAQDAKVEAEAKHNEIEISTEELNKFLDSLFSVEPAKTDDNLHEISDDELSQVLKELGFGPQEDAEQADVTKQDKFVQVKDQVTSSLTDLFNKAKNFTQDKVSVVAEKVNQIRDDIDYIKYLKEKYEFNFVSIDDETFTVSFDEFGPEFKFTFVDEHTLVKIAFKNSVTVPEKEVEVVDGVKVINHESKFNVARSVDFGYENAVIVDGLNDFDTLHDVINEYLAD